MAVKQWKRNEHGQRIGDDHPCAVLTDHEVELMRDLYELHHVPVHVLADKFGVHRNTASRIVNYQARVSTVKEKGK